MSKPALQHVVRLLCFTVAMMGSVAVGASTHAIDHPASVMSGSAAISLDAAPGETLLVARALTSDPATGTYFVESLEPALTTPAPTVAVRTQPDWESDLPRPDRWTSLLATLALVAFFFLRRIV